MDSERWHEVDRLFAEALERPPAERLGFPGSGLRRGLRPAAGSGAPAGRGPGGLPVPERPARGAAEAGARLSGGRREPRPLPAAADDRQRRHGHRLSRPPGGRALPARRRHQGPPLRPGDSGGRPSLPRRAADPGPASSIRTSPVCTTAGARTTAGPIWSWSWIEGLPVDQYCDQHRLTDRSAPHPLPEDLRRRPVRPPEPAGPSRSQAGQHPDHARGRAEAAGLRDRQAARAGARRLSPGDADRVADADPQLCQPRAGPGRGDHHGERCLLSRRDPLRAAGGPQPLSGRGGAAVRDRARHLRAGAGASQHGPFPAGNAGRGGDRAGPPDAAPASRPPAARRPRQHRPDGAAQGAPAAVRLGRPARRRTWRGTSRTCRSPRVPTRCGTGRGSSCAATGRRSRPRPSWALLVAGFVASLVAQGRQLAQERDKARYALSFLVDTFKQADPYHTLGESLTAREILDQGADRISRELTGQPDVQAAVMDAIGEVNLGLGRYDQAEPLLKRSLALRRQVFGPDSLEVAESLEHLAGLRNERSDQAGAESHLREALAIRRRQGRRGPRRGQDPQRARQDSRPAKASLPKPRPRSRRSIRKLSPSPVASKAPRGPHRGRDPFRARGPAARARGTMPRRRASSGRGWPSSGRPWEAGTRGSGAPAPASPMP